MKRFVGIIVLLILLGFALPAMFHALMALIVPTIVIVFIIGLGVLIFQRRRLW